MPQGFDLSSAYVDSGAVLPVFTKNTEIRENYDAERSIHGIEQPIKGKPALTPITASV